MKLEVVLERNNMRTRQPEEVVREVVELWDKGIYTLRGVARHITSIDGRIERQNIKLDTRTVKTILIINGRYEEC